MNIVIGWYIGSAKVVDWECYKSGGQQEVGLSLSAIVWCEVENL
jgi:hypothetical protein